MIPNDAESDSRPNCSECCTCTTKLKCRRNASRVSVVVVVGVVVVELVVDGVVVVVVSPVLAVGTLGYVVTVAGTLGVWLVEPEPAATTAAG